MLEDNKKVMKEDNRTEEEEEEEEYSKEGVKILRAFHTSFHLNWT